MTTISRTTIQLAL